MMRATRLSSGETVGIQRGLSSTEAYPVTVLPIGPVAEPEGRPPQPVAQAPMQMRVDDGRMMARLGGSAQGYVASPMDLENGGYRVAPVGTGRERYEEVDANPVRLVAEEPVSTFSIDVDTASYANVRRFLNDGVMPPVDAVRTEELINYFDYDYALPDSPDEPFTADVALFDSPWDEGSQLLRIGLQGYDLPVEERPRANLVFLIDTSGSMDSPDKLPLLKRSLRMLG